MNSKNNSIEIKIKLLDLPQVKFWRALMACHDLLYKHFEENLQTKGLSYSRFQILFYIYFNPKSSAVFLAEKMNVTRGNMSMFLKRMIEDQLIEEIFEKNKKRCAYKLSNAGYKLFEKSLEVHILEIEKTIPIEVQQLEKNLLRLNEVIKEKVDVG